MTRVMRERRRTSTAMHDTAPAGHARSTDDALFSYQELARLDEALTMSSRETGLRFTLYIGDLGQRTRIAGRGAVRPVRRRPRRRRC